MSYRDALFNLQQAKLVKELGLREKTRGNIMDEFDKALKARDKKMKKHAADIYRELGSAKVAAWDMGIVQIGDGFHPFEMPTFFPSDVIPAGAVFVFEDRVQADAWFARFSRVMDEV